MKNAEVVAVCASHRGSNLYIAHLAVQRSGSGGGTVTISATPAPFRARRLLVSRQYKYCVIEKNKCPVYPSLHVKDLVFSDLRISRVIKFPF